MSSASSQTMSSTSTATSTYTSSTTPEERAIFIERFNVPKNLLKVVAPLVESLQYNQFCLAYATISLAGEKKKPKAQKALLECFVQPTPLQFGALIEGVVEMEVDKCAGHEELLFRDNASYSTRFLDLLLQRYGREFFKKVLGSVKVKFKPEQLEVNPAKEPNADKLAQNAKNLIQLASKVLAALFERAHKFPPPIAHIIRLLSSRLVGVGSVRTAMSTIVFLKLLCPMICAGGLSISKSTTAQVALAKVLQAVATGIMFDDTNYLCCVNDYVGQFDRDYQMFCSSVLDRTAETKDLFTPPSQRTIIQEWLELIKFMQKYQEQLRQQCVQTTENGDSIPNQILVKQLDKSLAIATKGMPIFLLHLSDLA